MPDFLFLLAATFYWTTVLEGPYSGPFSILSRIRNAEIKDHPIHGGLMYCNVCLSVWVALVLVAISRFWKYGDLLIYGSAAAGIYVSLSFIAGNIGSVMRSYNLLINTRIQDALKVDEDAEHVV